MRRHSVTIGIALVLITIAVYAPVAGFPFVNWDDGEYVAANAHVQQGLSASNVSWALTSRVAGNWHPLTMMSHMLDVQLFGLDAGAHHIVNLAMHMLATLLLFGALVSMTGAVGRSGFVAAVFAVHPLHVESVAWISERKDVLSTMFVMLTLCAYAWYVRRPRWPRYLAVAGVYVLALLAKPMVVTLPIVLLLLDVWPLRRVSFGSEIRGAWKIVLAEKAGLMIPAIGVGLAAIAAQGEAIAGIGSLPLSMRIANAVTGYAVYLWKAVWPAKLAAFYPIQPHSSMTVAMVALALLAVSAAAVATARRWPFFLVGWFWFLVTLLPVSGIIQVGEQAFADRYMYFPLAGLTVAVAWGAVAAADRRRSARRAPGVAAIFAIAVLSFIARQQVLVWADSVTLWRHATGATDNNYRAYEKLAEAERDAGALTEAERHYVRALELAPPNSPRYRSIVLNALGIVRAQLGNAEAAVPVFQEAVRLNPAFSEAHSNLGAALATVGRVDEAAAHYANAIELTPAAAEAHMGLAGVRLTQGRAAEALQSYRRALSLTPDLAEAHAGAGAAAAALGRRHEAHAAFAEAVRLKPGLTSARVRWANLLIQEGRADDAIRELTAALASDPRQVSWRYALALLLIQNGRLEEGRRELGIVLSMQPDHDGARRALVGMGTR